jgi:hypothetical protein
MTHQDSVRTLALLFRASNEARPILLLGAGASFSSGVPVAAESVRRLARRVYAEMVKGGSVPPEQVRLSEWMSWLQNHDWFIKGDDRIAENFPLVVKNLLTPREYRARVLRDLFRPSNEIGKGYKSLAGLVLRGLARTILTTNFDTSLPISLNERRPHIPHVAEVNRHPGDLAEFSLFNRAQIVWLHGKAEQYSDMNAAGEVEKLDRDLIEKLVPMLADAPLIVIGYRGAEPSIMESLLAQNAARTNQFRNGIFWCVRTGETLHPSVEALHRSLSGNFKLLEIAGFDELLEDLGRELAKEDLYDSSRRKGISREVVKQRGEEPRAWFENEGFGYEIVQLDGVWAVRIKPFYMFTGRDAKKPLPSFARTARSTRRIKLDRNKNVEDDLTFWSRFLSESKPTINIGQRNVDDLILAGQFLTIDVPEQGLMEDDNENQDRMPA